MEANGQFVPNGLKNKNLTIKSLKDLQNARLKGSAPSKGRK